MRKILGAAALAMLAVLAIGCGSPDPATADRALCHEAFQAGGTTGSPAVGATIGNDSATSGATPALVKLADAFNTASGSAMTAENTTVGVGATMTADIAAMNAYGAVTDWCTSHGYSS